MYVLSLVFEVFSKESSLKLLILRKLWKGYFTRPEGILWTDLKKRVLDKLLLSRVCCCRRRIFHPHQVFPTFPCASRSENWSGWKLTVWKIDPAAYIATQILISTRQERMCLEVMKKTATPPLCAGWIG